MASEDLGYVRQTSEHGGTPLAGIAGINSAAVAALNALGIDDAEQLLGVAAIDGVRDELAGVLKAAGADLAKTLAAVNGALPQMAAVAARGPVSVGPLGA
jgi:hypothetical protein